MSMEYKKLKVTELRALLKAQKLLTTGKKADLIERLMKQDPGLVTEVPSKIQKIGDVDMKGHSVIASKTKKVPHRIGERKVMNEDIGLERKSISVSQVTRPTALESIDFQSVPSPTAKDRVSGARDTCTLDRNVSLEATPFVIIKKGDQDSQIETRSGGTTANDDIAIPHRRPTTSKQVINQKYYRELHAQVIPKTSNQVTIDSTSSNKFPPPKPFVAPRPLNLKGTSEAKSVRTFTPFAFNSDGLLNMYRCIDSAMMTFFRDPLEDGHPLPNLLHPTFKYNETFELVIALRFILKRLYMYFSMATSHPIFNRTGVYPSQTLLTSALARVKSVDGCGGGVALVELEDISRFWVISQTGEVIGEKPIGRRDRISKNHSMSKENLRADWKAHIDHQSTSDEILHQGILTHVVTSNSDDYPNGISKHFSSILPNFSTLEIQIAKSVILSSAYPNSISGTYQSITQQAALISTNPYLGLPNANKLAQNLSRQSRGGENRPITLYLEEGMAVEDVRVKDSNARISQVTFASGKTLWVCTLTGTVLGNEEDGIEEIWKKILNL